MTQVSHRRVGYVTLLGRPSSGKSSFVNAAIGNKISIVSSVPQTTRRLIRGIYTDKKSQIIFQDVPGLHSSSHNWNQSINWVTKAALGDTDVILRVIDGARSRWLEEEMIDKLVANATVPVITIVSKRDVMNDYETHLYPKDTIFVSNITKEGITEVLEKLMALLPEWPLLYPEDDVTDQDVYTRVGEIIREKIFLSTYQEVPHSTYVEVDLMEDKGKLVKILAYVYCMTESQKKILIGSHAAMIKEIGSLARKDLQDLFEKKVFLELHVKVSSGWQTRDTITRKILWKS